MKYFHIIFFLIVFYLLFNDFKKIVFEKFYDTVPTKCFDCEKEIIKKKGKKNAYLGAPTKCFSCQQEYYNKDVPVEFSNRTKCFSCQQRNNFTPGISIDRNSILSRNDINNRV